MSPGHFLYSLVVANHARLGLGVWYEADTPREGFDDICRWKWNRYMVVLGVKPGRPVEIVIRTRDMLCSNRLASHSRCAPAVPCGRCGLAD